MRIRYLHLPRCGPLVDIEIVFGQEDMLYGPGEPGKRKGAINFIVGVNGTGKSSLLRAIYQTFRALRAQELPPFPVTLAWDWDDGQETVTAVFHYPAKTKEKTVFAVILERWPDGSSDYWRHTVENLADESRRFTSNSLSSKHTCVYGEDAVKATILQAHLPRKVVAYTSGSETLWENLEQADYRPGIEQEFKFSPDEERPSGWAIDQEWKEKQSQFANAAMTELIKSPKIKSPKILDEDDTSMLMVANMLQRISFEIDPLVEIGTKLTNIQSFHANKNSKPCFLVRASDLRLAAVALALWQTAKELKGKNAEIDREGLRQQWLDRQAKGSTGDDARRMFNQLDWFWPTHLSFTYHDVDDRVSKRQHEQLLCLLALADEVTALPLGRYQAVIPLGPIERLDLEDRLKTVMPNGLLNDALNADAKWISSDNTTGAEAVMRVFSGNRNLDTMLVEVFETLRNWQASGLLEDITLTIKRLSRVKATDGEPDDVLVTFDQLSDGEQMLLGRMALLYLLRGQHGALLLLDEPETHFNDVWKREIIDWIDDAILKDTAAQVIVATHTSIALTDVFASEIVLLRRDAKTGQFYEAEEPIETFGATPEDILRDIFGADEIIGHRAAQILDLVLIVSANPVEAAPLWETGEFSGPNIEALWSKTNKLPHSYISQVEFADFLSSIWSYTRNQLGGTTPPRLVDTLKTIEKKLGPGHYQFEFRRRIHAQMKMEHATSN